VTARALDDRGELDAFSDNVLDGISRVLRTRNAAIDWNHRVAAPNCSFTEVRIEQSCDVQPAGRRTAYHKKSHTKVSKKNMALSMTSWLIWISIVQYFRNSDYLFGKPKLLGVWYS